MQNNVEKIRQYLLINVCNENGNEKDGVTKFILYGFRNYASILKQSNHDIQLTEFFKTLSFVFCHCITTIEQLIDVEYSGLWNNLLLMSLERFF